MERDRGEGGCPCSQTHLLSLIIGTSFHKAANAKKERKESKSKRGGLANSFSVFRLESSSPRAREFPEQGRLVDGLLTPNGFFYRGSYLSEVQSFVVSTTLPSRRNLTHRIADLTPPPRRVHQGEREGKGELGGREGALSGKLLRTKEPLY